MAMAFVPGSEGLSQTLAAVHGEVVGDAQVPLPQYRSRRHYSRARRHKEVGMWVIQSEKRLGYTPTLWATARTWAPWLTNYKTLSLLWHPPRDASCEASRLALADRQITIVE